MRRPSGMPPRALEVRGAAKVNLGLEVGAVRDDGYHDVRGLVQTISIADVLTIQTHPDDGDVRAPVTVDAGGAMVGLEVAGRHAVGAGPGVLGDLESPDNLVLRAARRLAEIGPALPTTIRLEKGIPVAAGLGGGSADAAAALTGLSVAWGLGVTAGDLIRIGGELGADVPAITLGGLVHVSGRGERVRSAGRVEDTAFVIGTFSSGISTAVAYRTLDELRERDAVGRAPQMWANDLEPVALRLVPEIRAGLDGMHRAGVQVAFVTGSGPSVVAVCEPEAADRVARHVQPAFDDVFAALPVPWGVRLVLRGAGRR